jgi:transposase
MSEPFAPATTETAFVHDTTLAVALELSGKTWEVGAIVPGVARRPRRRLQPRDMTGLLTQLDRWRTEALKAGRAVHRVVVTYEAGRDGFWIARYLLAHGIEVRIMHPASIPVERGRRAKTGRIDLDMLLRTFLAWLRGEPRVCSMVPIPDITEEDMRRPERERGRLVSERVAVENRIGNLLCLHGIVGFKPPLRKAVERLEELRCFDGAPLPPKLMEELRRLMVRHGVLSAQLKEIETAREQAMMAADADEKIEQIRLPAALVGLGLATSTALVREVFARSFRDRKALAGFCGLTGTPFNSGGRERGQGISKSGNPRIRRSLLQLAWRWLRHQPDSALGLWFVERVGDSKGRVRKIAVVALARELLVALWRYLETGEVPAGARLAAA